MTITNGPNLGLMANGAAGEAHYSQFMAFLRGVDGLVMPSVKGYLANTPPGSHADGDCYIIGAAPTGVWAGQGGKVTRYSTVAVAWEFFTPKNGWMLQANTAREIYLYNASAWELFYQEGTWTPTLAGSTTAGSHTYSIQAANYTKIGRTWFVSANLTLTAKDAAMAGNATVAGLPASAPIVAPLHSGILGMWSNITLSASYTALQMTFYGTSVLFTQCGSTMAALNIGASAISSTTAIRLSGTFVI